MPLSYMEYKKDTTSNKIHLLIVCGIRSHYIKIAAMQRALATIDPSKKAKFRFTFVDVKQHYSPTLSDNFINELNLHFDYSVEHSSTNSNQIFGTILSNLCDLIDDFDDYAPVDYVVAIGDVATTAIASIAALLKRKKFIHLEAGERHKYVVGLEESCRYIADQAASILFATTKRDYLSLCEDKTVDGKQVFFSGDVVYDLIKQLPATKESSFNYIIDNTLHAFEFSEESYSLVSLHHLENLSHEVLSTCFEMIKDLGNKIVFIAHPRVRQLLAEYGINTNGVLVVDQIPYFQNLIAIKNAEYIITDSGGMQKEAYYLDKRCAVRSNEIVWESIISLGANIKFGSNRDDFKIAIDWLKENSNKSFEYNGEFGNGTAMETILNTILQIERGECI